MRIRDIMSKDVLSIAPDASLGEARTRMKVGRVRHLLITRNHEIVGVLSERDLGGSKLAAGEGGVISDVMTENVVTATPDMTIRQAANLLRGRSIGCLPIVERDRPVGIVTTTDLLELVGRGVEKPIERSTRWTLGRRGPRRTGATARRERHG